MPSEMNQEPITPEVGKWYELKGGAIVPCLELCSDGFASAEFGVKDRWVLFSTILREVPNPHAPLTEEDRAIVERLKSRCEDREAKQGLLKLFGETE